jgi:hypothetical protein
VPTQDHVGLHQQDSVAPVVDQPRQQDNQAAFVWSECGTFDATGGNNQLLPEQDVLGDELPPGAAQVGNEPDE